jgi:hypothetical protein
MPVEARALERQCRAKTRRYDTQSTWLQGRRAVSGHFWASCQSPLRRKVLKFGSFSILLSGQNQAKCKSRLLVQSPRRSTSVTWGSRLRAENQLAPDTPSRSTTAVQGKVSMCQVQNDLRPVLSGCRRERTSGSDRSRAELAPRVTSAVALETIT